MIYDVQNGGNVVAAVATIPEPNIQLVSPPTLGIAGHLEWVLVSSLSVDARYQRDVSPSHVKNIVKHFDPDTFGVLVVSERSDGMYIVDGQHRVAALRAMGWQDQRVPCLVYRGLSIEEEAKVFYKPQTERRSMTPAARFKARLVAGEPSAVAIAKCVESYGFNVNLANGGNVHPRDIDAVASLERIARQYGFDHLPVTMSVIRDIYGTDHVKITSALMLGIATFVHRYQGLYDKRRLFEVLHKLTPQRLEANGKDIAKLLGAHSDTAVGRAILRQYNKGLQTRRLPEWDEMKGRK